MFTAEPLFAEAHDGDAVVVTMSEDAGAPGTGTSAPAGHTVHMCHCVHAHGAVPAFEEQASGPSLTAPQLVDSAPLHPANRALEPGLRPPIA